MLKKININPQRKILIVYIVLTVVTLAVFWQVNQYDFVYFDDGVYVTNNIHIQSGITLDGIRWAFSTTYAEFWHPLTWLSLMFDYQLHGLNAGGYHLTNLILHVMSALLLFWLFNRMTGAIWKSAFVAALFALHPLRVESVAWVAERKDVLSAFFWMLTLCFYVYYTEKPVIRRYLLVLFSFVCGLMSKSMVVTLPVVMILLDYWPMKRFHSQKDLILWQLREKIPFFIFSAIFSIITFYAQYTSKISPLNFIYPLVSRLANAPISFMTYLEKTFWPHDMALNYPFPAHIPIWQVLGASLLMVILSAAVIALAKRLPHLFVGWLWYATTILPVIGILPISDPMADRYIYIPSIGIAIVLAWGIPLLFPRENIRKKILFPAGIIVVAILSVLTWKQCGYWKDDVALFNHAFQVTKDNTLLIMMHNNLASSLDKEGKISEAIYHYNEAILLQPDYAHAYNKRGGLYVRLGQYQLAIKDYNEAIRLKPDDASAYNNRGITYDRLGQYQLAIKDYNEAIRIKPDYPLAYKNRGLSYFRQGSNELGCRDAQKACELGDCKLLELAKGRGDCR
jgi:protein O-mannosyl-transferase